MHVMMSLQVMKRIHDSSDPARHRLVNKCAARTKKKLLLTTDTHLALAGEVSAAERVGVVLERTLER